MRNKKVFILFIMCLLLLLYLHSFPNNNNYKQESLKDGKFHKNTAITIDTRDFSSFDINQLDITLYNTIIYDDNQSIALNTSLYDTMMSFTDDDVDTNPDGWSISEYTAKGVNIEEEYKGHGKVCKVSDNSSSVPDYIDMNYYFDTIWNGTTEGWFMITSTSDYVRPMCLRYPGGQQLFMIYFESGWIKLYNGADNPLLSVEPYTWYNVLVDFTTNTSYQSLEPYTLRVYINNESYGVYPTETNLTTGITRWTLTTYPYVSTCNLYMDALAISYQEGYYRGISYLPAITDGYATIRFNWNNYVSHPYLLNNIDEIHYTGSLKLFCESITGLVFFDENNISSGMFFKDNWEVVMTFIFNISSSPSSPTISTPFKMSLKVNEYNMGTNYTDWTKFLVNSTHYYTGHFYEETYLTSKPSVNTRNLTIQYYNKNIQKNFTIQFYCMSIINQTKIQLIYNTPNGTPVNTVVTGYSEYGNNKYVIDFIFNFRHNITIIMLNSSSYYYFQCSIGTIDYECESWRYRLYDNIVPYIANQSGVTKSGNLLTFNTDSSGYKKFGIDLNSLTSNYGAILEARLLLTFTLSSVDPASSYLCTLDNGYGYYSPSISIIETLENIKYNMTKSYEVLINTETKKVEVALYIDDGDYDYVQISIKLRTMYVNDTISYTFLPLNDTIYNILPVNISYQVFSAYPLSYYNFSTYVNNTYNYNLSILHYDYKVWNYTILVIKINESLLDDVQYFCIKLLEYNGTLIINVNEYNNVYNNQNFSVFIDIYHYHRCNITITYFRKSFLSLSPLGSEEISISEPYQEETLLKDTYHFSHSFTTGSYAFNVTITTYKNTTSSTIYFFDIYEYIPPTEPPEGPTTSILFDMRILIYVLIGIAVIFIIIYAYLHSKPTKTILIER